MLPHEQQLQRQPVARRAVIGPAPGERYGQLELSDIEPAIRSAAVTAATLYAL
jgi:hypothetical protein